MFYAAASLEPGARLAFPPEYEERAAYVAEGMLSVAGERYSAGSMLVFAPREEAVLEALSAARVLLLGGAPSDGPRHIWWNFVSSSRERIAAAARDWKAGRFAQVPGETEFIPLPDTPLPVHYP